MAHGDMGWRARASNARRERGDEITAQWCEAMADQREAEARTAELARQHADTVCLKGSPDHAGH